MKENKTASVLRNRSIRRTDDTQPQGREGIFAMTRSASTDHNRDAPAARRCLQPSRSATCNTGTDYRETVYPRNLRLGVALEAFWQLGMSFIILSTIQVGFLSRLTSSKILIGVYLAIGPLTMSVVPLFCSHVFRDQRSHKKWLIVLHLVYVLAWGTTGLAILFLWEYIGSRGILGLLFMTTLVCSLSMACIVPVWFDFMTERIIPGGKKGRYFGTTVAAGSLCAVGGAYLSRLLLKAARFPANFGWSFLLFSVMGSLSVSCMSLLQEGKGPRAQTSRRPSLQMHFLQLRLMLKRNRALRIFLLASVFVSSGSVVLGFLSLYATTTFAISAEVLGTFSLFMVGGQCLSAAVLGRLGDRKGHRKSYVICIVCYLASLVTAIISPSAAWLLLAFFLYGGYLGYSWLGPANIVTDLAAEGEVQSTLASYYAVVNPFLAVIPPLCGILVDIWGYRAVSCLFLLLTLTGLVLVQQVPVTYDHDTTTLL